MKVYYKKYEGDDFSILSKLSREVLDYIIAKENIELEKNIPIKVHFGEKGNTTFIRPETYHDMINYLKDRKIETSFIETNVLYKGARTVRDDHIQVAKEHGFTEIPIIIADGYKGEEIHKVTINKPFFNEVKLGKEFKNYNQYIVTSHFKGHRLAGFGGAIKQLSMGFAARSGKLEQHATIVPIISEKKCVACGVCEKNCDVDAIKIEDIAIIDEDKCVGCAGCIAVCPFSAISNDWSGENFLLKVAEYAYGAQLNKNNIYISYMINITELCDCIGSPLKPIAKNYGILASTDPVALDTACIDLLQKDYKGMFNSGRITLDYCKEINFGTNEYELIEI